MWLQIPKQLVALLSRRTGNCFLKEVRQVYLSSQITTQKTDTL